jgi:hypothetical protein
MRHPRHYLAWFCMAASLWMGAGMQWHGLSHALRAVDAVHTHDGVPEHEAPCDQCLLFASTDGAMPTAGLVVLPAPVANTTQACAALECRASVFTAYVSRAPPVKA